MGLFDVFKKDKVKSDDINQKLNCIDVLDNGVNFNGHLLTFPISYDELKAVIGEAELCPYGKEGNHISYVYDNLGIDFDGATAYLSELKKKKAYVDDEHTIIGLTLYATNSKIYSFIDRKPKKRYVGNLTFLGQKMIQSKMSLTYGGYSYVHPYQNESDEKEELHVSAAVYIRDCDTNKSINYNGQLYDGDRFLHDVNLTFKPERPKSNENYNIVIPDEECLAFDTFNFKLAVVNELMYNQEVLKPYFDIYDYMAFKKARWNLETYKNVRAAVNFFKELPIPARLADFVTEIKMDGDNEIYMQIAPEWDGRDERFDFYKLTESELSQFKNLKKMQILGNDNDAAKLRKICEPLGIEVEPLIGFGGEK